MNNTPLYGFYYRNLIPNLFQLNGDASPSLNGLHLTPVASNQLINGQICNDAATMTEPDSLGPCEPGTAVKLQGIVWQETEKG